MYCSNNDKDDCTQFESYVCTAQNTSLIKERGGGQLHGWMIIPSVLVVIFNSVLGCKNSLMYNLLSESELPQQLVLICTGVLVSDQI